MADGRVSQVRFEALAFRLGAFPAATRFKRWCAYAPPSHGLLVASSLALAAVWFARFYQAEPAPVVGTTKCPESLCLMLALPPSGRRVPPPPRTLLLSLRSYRLMRQSRVALLYFGLWPRSWSLRRLLPAPAATGILPTLSLQICPRMPGPLPRRSHRVHLPVSSSVSSAFPRPLSSRLPVSSANTIFPR